MNLVSDRRIFNQIFQHIKLHPINTGAKLLITHYNFLCLINTLLKRTKKNKKKTKKTKKKKAKEFIKKIGRYSHRFQPPFLNNFLLLHLLRASTTNNCSICWFLLCFGSSSTITKLKCENSSGNRLLLKRLMVVGNI